VKTIIGLFLIDALYTFVFRYWADHDPKIQEPVIYWVIIPSISVLSVAMAFLQLYLFKHPELADTEES